MAIRVQRYANVSKQATLLDGLDVSPLKWRVCGCGLNPFVHEGMNHISNVEVHLKTRSGNVNIKILTIVHAMYQLQKQQKQNNNTHKNTHSVLSFVLLFIAKRLLNDNFHD